jgi:hypothetical protein
MTGAPVKTGLIAEYAQIGAAHFSMARAEIEICSSWAADNPF